MMRNEHSNSFAAMLVKIILLSFLFLGCAHKFIVHPGMAESEREKVKSISDHRKGFTTMGATVFPVENLQIAADSLRWHNPGKSQKEAVSTARVEKIEFISNSLTEKLMKPGKTWLQI